MRISTAVCLHFPLPLLAFLSPSVSFRALPASMLPFLYLPSLHPWKTLSVSLLPLLPVSPRVFALLFLPQHPVVVCARAGVPALFAASSFSPDQLTRSE